MAESVSPGIIELLKNVVKEDIKNFTICVKHNKKGEGYLGEISFLTLKEKTSGKTYSFVAKQAFDNDDLRQNFSIRDVFINEIYFYSEVWRKFREFQLSVPSVKLFDKIPKYIANSRKEFSEIIILENLQLKKFVSFNKFSSFNSDHAELIFKSYGRFHAISFAYRVLHPEEFSEISKELKDQWNKFIKSFTDFFKVVHQISQKNLLLPEDQKVLEKYNNYVENCMEIFSESLIYEGNYSAVLHGDCWSNNMLFKYDASGKIVDLRLLDFQFSRIGTPVYDLSYCLYSGAGKEIYEDLDHYLREYHNSFSETAAEFGCDPNSLYPFAVLKDDWKKYCKFGFLMGLLIWKGRLTYEESVMDLSDFQNSDSIADEFLGAKYDEKTYKNISRNLIIHMYENDYL